MVQEQIVHIYNEMIYSCKEFRARIRRKVLKVLFNMVIILKRLWLCEQLWCGRAWNSDSTEVTIIIAKDAHMDIMALWNGYA